MLKRVAAAGNGGYFYAGSNGALQAVFNAIDTIERVEQRSLLRTERDPYFQIVLFVALICLLFDIAVRRLLTREVL